VDAPVTVPYLTTATFKASPTYLDLGNLRSGDTNTADQDDELYNQLLIASAWASNTICNQPLHAHYNTEQLRLRAGRDGLLKWHPAHNPVRLVTAFAYGYSPGVANLRTVTDLTGQWIENDEQIVMPFGPLSPGFSTLQFSPPAVSSELYTQWTYLAAFHNSTLSAQANVGATSVTPVDVTGLIAGDVLRIWDPGKEEVVKVAPGYVTGAATVPLTSALVSTHAAGAGISGMPADVIQACVYKTIDQLQRPGTTRSDQWPGRMKPTTGGKTMRPGSVWEDKAMRLLSSYAAVR
jgi:hypothetical protein